jgi:hypothetical protein
VQSRGRPTEEPSVPEGDGNQGCCFCLYNCAETKIEFTKGGKGALPQGFETGNIVLLFVEAMVLRLATCREFRLREASA